MTVAADELADAHKRRDWEACVRIIDEFWLPLLTDRDLDLLSRAVFDLPPEARRSSPIVAHLAEVFGVVPLGEVLVDLPTDASSINDLARSATARPLIGAVTAAMIARRTQGHNRAARSLAVAGTEIVARSSLVAVADGPDPMPGNNVTDLKCFFHVQAGLSCQYADDRPLALRMFADAWRARHHDCSDHAARAAAVRLAVEAALSGESGEAHRWLDRAAEEPGGRGQIADWIENGVALAEFLLAQESLDPDAMARTSMVADSSELEEQWPFVAWAAGRYAVLCSEPERALTLLARMKDQFPRVAQSDGVHRGLIAMATAEAELALGHGNRALAALAGTDPTSYFGRLTEARTYLLAGEDEQARAVASETAGRDGLLRRARIEALLIKAVAEVGLGLPDAAPTARRAAAMIDVEGPSALLGVPRQALAQLAAADPEAAPLVAGRDELPVVDIYPESIDLVRLTERESTVLDHLAAGTKRAALADALYVSENTVKSQMRTLYAKLDVKTREAAVARARELGLLGSDSGTGLYVE